MTGFYIGNQFENEFDNCDNINQELNYFFDIFHSHTQRVGKVLHGGLDSYVC